MIIKNIAKYLDKTYVKNRLTYAIVENILLSGSSQDDNAVQKKLKQEENVYTAKYRFNRYVGREQDR